MKYRNEISCPNCNSINFDYDFKCQNCKSFLRERIINIDLGETILRLIDSPGTTFSKIKLAEHKNYLLFIILFLAIRFLIISRFISVPFAGDKVFGNLIILFATSFLWTIILLVSVSFLVKNFFEAIKIKSRIKDILSVLTYSFIPNLFALFILFPIEIVFYGEYLFSNNPYPYQIKQDVFYFLLTLEILTILWSLFLLIIGIKEFVKNRLLSATLSLIIYIFISITLFLQSKFFLIQ